MKTHVGHYEIVAELGRGGMGVVYKGYEPSLGRNVAIKELSAALAHDSLVVERFLREARSMAMLNDPHIIQIYSIGQENDQPFFVMEFVDGVSVAALITRDGKLSPGDSLKILRQTAQGLAAAHDRGVIHRDVKPANLMISQRGQIKIADFGIALANHEVDSKLTSQGELVGTPGYLSPEILLGNPVDERSDVYALGIVLFEMLIGRTPFSEVSVYKLIQAVVESDVPDIRALDPSIDPALAAIVAKMLDKNPDQRYQNMHELIVDLDRQPLLQQGGPIEVSIPAARVAPSTMIGVPMATPGGGSRLTPGGSGRISTPPPDMSRKTPLPRATPAPDAAARAKAMFAEPASAPEPVKKPWWPVMVMAVLMFLAGATLALHGQIFGASAPEVSSTTSGTESPAQAIAEEHEDTMAAYYEAGIVALFGLLMTGYWFGIYSRRKRESEVGIHSLANMKWRECIGLVLEAMRREGYEEAPSSKQPGDGGTDFLLIHDGSPVLLGYKHGTAYRIGDANIREFAHAVEMQGAKVGLLATLGRAEAAARDLAKRYNIEIIDGPSLWPKVRPFVSPNTLDHIRLQSSAQAWKGIWIGGACSLAFAGATFLAAKLMSPEQKTAVLAQVSAVTRPAARPTAAVAASSADQAIKQINETAQAMAAVAKLTDAQLAQRRADAAKQVSSIVQVSSAGWSSESTLLLALKQSDGADKALIDEVCRILTQYEELRYTRLQLQPPVNSTAPVRWKQCQ